jgi:HAMP domain-containing protein
MMLRRAFGAVWDFVVGDDWRLAAAAIAAIGLTAIFCAFGLSAWWVAPLVALLALRRSLRAGRPSATKASSTSS